MSPFSDARGDLRLGVVIHRLDGGGAEHIARTWVSSLHDLGIDLVVYLKDPLDTDLAPPPGITVRTNPAWATRGRGLLYPLWLGRELRRDRRDVVLSILQYSAVVSHLATLGRRSRPILIASERNMPAFRRRAPNPLAGLRRRLLAIATRWAYLRADAMVAPSHPVAAASAASYRIPSDRLFVVPNPAAPSDHAIARRRPRSGDGVHLVFVGRLSPDKRLDLFLDTVDVLRGRGVAIRATIIGDGVLRAHAEQRVAAEDLPVTFAGWRRSWWEQADEFDCLLMTSPSEGFGNVLVEAASAGVAVVAGSRALSVADAVVPGITGELTVTDTADAFADGVLRAVGGTPPSPDVVSRWLERFSVDASTSQLLDVLDAVRSRGERP